MGYGWFGWEADVQEGYDRERQTGKGYNAEEEEQPARPQGRLGKENDKKEPTPSNNGQEQGSRQEILNGWGRGGFHGLILAQRL